MTTRQTAGRLAKRHGRQTELRAWQQFVDEGFHVVIGGSGRTRDDVVDMVAVGKNVIRLISVKHRRIYGKDREAELDALFPLGRFPGVSRELWEFDSKTRKFTVSHV